MLPQKKFFLNQTIGAHCAIISAIRQICSGYAGEQANGGQLETGRTNQF